MAGPSIPPRATTLLVQVVASDLQAPILDATDGRWDRLRSSCPPDLDLRDRFRGALIGGAIGDAMGRPYEGRPANEARARKLRTYQAWHGWTGGPKGTITDDTQMTMWLAESLLASAERAAGAGEGDLWDHLLDPDDLAKRFTREHIRGIGQAVRKFVHNAKDIGKPWYEAGVPSAGNGTAMRAAPVGLVHLGDPYRIYRDSLLQVVVTHRDSMAIAAAACQAYAVARAAAALPGSLASLESRVALCADLATLLAGLERPGYELRGGSGAPSLHGRIGPELPRYLQEGRPPFADWYNGAYVLESLPCALWCFLATPEDFEQTLFTAVDAGYDADTVAAMACTLSGAYHGYSRLPQRLVADLEYHDRLIALAEGLYVLYRRCHMLPDLPPREGYRARALPEPPGHLVVGLQPRTGGAPREGRLEWGTGSRATLTLTVGSDVFHGEGGEARRALETLAGRLAEQGFRIACCGTCHCFRFSSMSYQMSEGTKGYCALGKEDDPAGSCTQADVVTIWDVCTGFRYGPEHAWDD